MDSRIRALDGYLYSICGKLICFAPDVLDLTDPETVSDLIGFASGIYSEESTVRRAYGRETVCTLRSGRSPDEVIIEVYPVDALPEGSRALVRKELGLDG